MIYDLEQKTRKELVEICKIQIQEYQKLTQYLRSITPETEPEILTTRQLADKFNTSLAAVRQAKYVYGHFKWYEPLPETKNNVMLKWKLQYA